MKTAIEWFALELYEKFEMKGNGNVFNDLLEKAKEMEKEQMIELWNIAVTCESFEQYYNETFKSE